MQHPQQSTATVEQAAVKVPAPTSQTFFAKLAADIRRPGFGDAAKQWTQEMLKRAEADGLYDPSK